MKVEEEQKTTENWFKWHEPDRSMEWTNNIPSEEDPMKTFEKGHCNVDYYRLNVGGSRELAPIPGTPYWDYQIVGGTTYRQFIDFNYVGILSLKWEYYENGDLMSLTSSITGTYTFIPESLNHDIDGTIKFSSRTTFTQDPNGNLETITGAWNGHGTGDLEGVTIKAESTWIYDPQYRPFPYGLFEITAFAGTVKGWPTHLNTPNPHADIRIAHPRRGDLIVDIGVGDPSSPRWSQRLWNGEGGYMDDLDLCVDLSAVVAYLPPDGNQWFLKVYDHFYYFNGYITEFTITYEDITYASADPPVLVKYPETSYAFIPS